MRAASWLSLRATIGERITRGPCPVWSGVCGGCQLKRLTDSKAVSLGKPTALLSSPQRAPSISAPHARWAVRLTVNEGVPLHRGTGPTRVRVLHCHGFFTAMQCRMTNIRRGSSPASVTDLAPAQAATPIATLPASQGAWTQCLRNRVCRRARTGRCNFKPVRLSGGGNRGGVLCQSQHRS